MRTPLLVAGLAVLAAPAAGQKVKFDIAAEAFAYFVDRPTDVDDLVCNRYGCRNIPIVAPNQQENGTWMGARTSLRFRWISLTVEGIWGQLEANGQALHDLDPRVTRAQLQMHVGRWLSIGPTVDAWRSDRMADGTVYDILIRRYGMGLNVSGSLGVPGLRGSFQVDAFPVGEYFGDPDLDAPVDEFGFSPDNILTLNNGSNSNTRFLVELEYAPDRIPLMLKFGFRSERFFFDGGIGEHENQLRGIYVGGGVRVRR